MTRKNRKTAIKRGQKNQNQMMQSRGMGGIPTRFPMSPGDVVHAVFKASTTLSTAALASSTGTLVVLGQGASGSGYLFADDLFVGFGALCIAYSRFLVKRLRVVARSVNTTISGGYVAANYEPTSSSLAGVPTTLADVSNAVHYTSASAGAPGEFTVLPVDYYNDWRQTPAGTDVATNNLSQMGCVQLFSVGPSSTLLGIVDLEIDCCFTGYRL